MNTKDGLLSFNNFISTSAHCEVAIKCAENVLTDPVMIGIILKMTIDLLISSAFFLVLINYQFYQVELKLTTYEDQPTNFCNNIDEVYRKMTQFPKALLFYGKPFPSNHLDFAQSYNNNAIIYLNTEVLSVWERLLPENHSQFQSIRADIDTI
ncbi:unnamed protein product [Adineta steineri]|uniref:Uncharacterized protein n=1 Tax=Adineta steineri TaxID=433720 RepID=A0A818RSI9_9BILA|nr:unnamed protein product [Adineta steineri]